LAAAGLRTTVMPLPLATSLPAWVLSDVSETELKDQAGKPVAKAKGITVVRNPDAAKK